jgi:glycosyltransferase involved in cell wall biosynthesis
LKLFEFWAAGVPVVASDLPSIRALARDGETALLCEPSAAALARSVERLLGDPELARHLADSGRAAAAAWTWDDRARRILDFIASVTP